MPTPIRDFNAYEETFFGFDLVFGLTVSPQPQMRLRNIINRGATAKGIPPLFLILRRLASSVFGVQRQREAAFHQNRLLPAVSIARIAPSRREQAKEKATPGLREQSAKPHPVIDVVGDEIRHADDGLPLGVAEMDFERT